MRRSVLVAVLAGLAAASCGLPHGPFRAEARNTWSRTYPLSQSGSVSIRNVNGRVEIEGVDSSTVEVQAERIARAATDQLAQELLPRIPIDDRSTPDSVVIETGRISGILIGASFEVIYHVKAPKSATIHATTVNGGVRLEGLAGRVTADTTNGGIRAFTMSGGLAAKTVNGGVHANFSGLGSGDVKIETVNGGVHIGLPEKGKATVTATWVNGGFDPGGLNFDVRDRGKRHFEGLLNGGGTSITATTVNGGINLATGADAANDGDFDNAGPQLKKHEPVAP